MTKLSIEQFRPTEHAIDLRTPEGAEQVATWLERATKVAPELAATPPPTAEELRLVREELDPGGVYTK